MTKRDGGKAFLKPKNKGGRPSKLNDELIEKICRALKHGAFIETAAAYCGVSKVILYEWMKLGNAKPNSIHGRFLDAVTKAMAEAEINDLMYISKARAKSWQASAWRLQRKFPGKWGPAARPRVQDESAGQERSFKLSYNIDDIEVDDAEVE